VLLLAIVVADLLRTRKSSWTGVGVGIAAGIKLTPLIFIPVPAADQAVQGGRGGHRQLRRHHRAGLRAKPGDAYAYWVGQKFSEVARVGDVWSTGNQTCAASWPVGVAARGTQNAWVLLAAVIGVLGLAAAVLAHRRGEELLAVSLVGLCSTAVSPYRGRNHWVWFVPLFVFALHPGPDHRPRPPCGSSRRTSSSRLRLARQLARARSDRAGQHRHLDDRLAGRCPDPQRVPHRLPGDRRLHPGAPTPFEGCRVNRRGDRNRNPVATAKVGPKPVARAARRLAREGFE